MKFNLFNKTLLWLFCVICICSICFTQCGVDRSQTLILGCKNFTEQIILGEIIAQTIEDNTDLNVVRKWNLGGTMVCHQALVSGEIDIYPEYTGTAYITILGNQEIKDATSTFQTVQDEYQKRFQCEWLPPFGLNNTYTITVWRGEAEQWKLKTISDLKERAPKMIAGFTAEFMERPDGYPKLKEKYGLNFAKVVDMEPGLMYQAISDNEVNVICGFSTDGRIPAYNLVALEDDLNFFPPYYAAPVARLEVLQQHPELKALFQKLAGSIDNDAMQQMNLQVDEKKMLPETVAKDFLKAL
ncbi:glycine/betaine ABC transporter substrate-binding protein [bacterium]|nr:glycine/betaine ABC transporter substrate-binding protein [bacterium]